MAVGLALICMIAGADAMERSAVVLDIQTPAYSIINTNLGHKIVIEDYGYLNAPGKPLIPARNYLVALPPGARAVSVEITVTDSAELPGRYTIMPSPPIVPVERNRASRELARRLRQEWVMSNDETYADDSVYPESRGGLIMRGALRKYSYASVSFYPFGYRPVSGKLIHYGSARIRVYYELPSAGGEAAHRLEELMKDTLADDLASMLFANYHEMRALYEPPETNRQGGAEGSGFFIITHPSLLGAIEASGFLARSITTTNTRTCTISTCTAIHR